jgi:hypothetical protein
VPVMRRGLCGGDLRLPDIIAGRWAKEVFLTYVITEMGWQLVRRPGVGTRLTEDSEMQCVEELLGKGNNAK